MVGWGTTPTVFSDVQSSSGPKCGVELVSTMAACLVVTMFPSRGGGGGVSLLNRSAFLSN